MREVRARSLTAKMKGFNNTTERAFLTKSVYRCCLFYAPTPLLMIRLGAGGFRAVGNPTKDPDGGRIMTIRPTFLI